MCSELLEKLEAHPAASSSRPHHWQLAIWHAPLPHRQRTAQLCRKTHVACKNLGDADAYGVRHVRERGWGRCDTRIDPAQSSTAVLRMQTVMTQCRMMEIEERVPHDQFPFYCCCILNAQNAFLALGLGSSGERPDRLLTAVVTSEYVYTV